MSKLTSVTDNKINEFFEKSINLIPIKIERNLENDSIKVEIKSVDSYIIIFTLTKSKLKFSHKYFDENDYFKKINNFYQQWLIAVHRHPLQENNPFLTQITLDPLERIQQYRNELYKDKTDEDLKQMCEETKTTLLKFREAHTNYKI